GAAITHAELSRRRLRRRPGLSAGVHGLPERAETPGSGKSQYRASAVFAPKLDISVRTPRLSRLSFCANSSVDGFSFVNVVGQVARPSGLPYSEGMRVLDAIQAVGGLTQFASGEDARTCAWKMARRRSSTTSGKPRCSSPAIS